MIALTLLALSAGHACEAVADATVHLPDGPHAGWHVAWNQGAITAVGEGAPPSACTVVHRGGEVTAGLIAATTHMGVVEIELEATTRDDAWGDPWDGDAVRAAHQPVLAYNPRSTVVPVTRLGGITTAAVHPRGGLVAGQIGVVSLGPTRQQGAILDVDAGLAVQLDVLGSRAAGLTRLRELLDDARHYADGTPYEGLSDLSASRLDLEALAATRSPARVPLFVHADRAADIEAVLRLGEALDVELVIVGAAEGWLVADRLAARDVPVLVDPLVYGAGSFDQVQGRPDNPALLAAAGVPVGITIFETHNARALRFQAGNAVRGGMDHAQAIAAITAVPARILGLDDRGTLRPGAAADLAVWSGDPLEIGTRLEGLTIGGEAQPLASRQTALVEAYRTLPRDVTALPSP